MINIHTPKNKKGQGLVEYIMIVALIAIAVYVVVQLFGTKVRDAFTNATETVESLSDNG